MSVYELLVCLYVCLSTQRAYLRNYMYMSDLRQIFVRFSDCCGSVLLWRRYDMYFIQVLWMTLYLHVIGHAEKCRHRCSN